MTTNRPTISATSRATSDASQRREIRRVEREEEIRLEVMERAAFASQTRINALERQAQKLMAAHIKGPNSEGAITAIFSTPGMRNIRSLARPGKTTVRPKSSSGKVSFHFSVTSVSKGGELADVLSGRKSPFSASSNASKHEKYVEREDAVERFYVATNTSVTTPAGPGIASDPSALGMQNYIEDPEKVEVATNAATGETVLSSFGNISRFSDERADFWQAVEDMEQNPAPPRVILNPNVAVDVWDRVREHMSAGNPTPPAVESALDTGKAINCVIDNREGIAILRLFRQCGLRDFVETQKAEEQLPVKFVLGKGGRVQTRLVVELPHEMDPAQRLTLAQQFCAPYEAQGTPYWAVIHAPNKHNDDRNFHLHINLSERPAKKILHPDTGLPCWDFEYVEHFKTERRQARTRRPFCQSKLKAINHRDWVRNERCRFANLANAHLAKAGIDKQLDPRSYEEMGIDKVASDRIAPAAFARERKGLATVAGIEVAQRQWAEQESAILTAAEKLACDVANSCGAIRQAIKPHVDRGSPEAKEIQKIAATLVSRYEERGNLSQELDAQLYVAARLSSRAGLKSIKERDEADIAALEVATEIKSKISELRLRFDRLTNDLRTQTASLNSAIAKDAALIEAEKNFGSLNDAYESTTFETLSGPVTITTLRHQPSHALPDALHDAPPNSLAPVTRKAPGRQQHPGSTQQPVDTASATPPASAAKNATPSSEALAEAGTAKAPTKNPQPTQPHQELTVEQAAKRQALKKINMEIVRRVAIARNSGRGR